jgi:GAF domain-containing protein
MTEVQMQAKLVEFAKKLLHKKSLPEGLPLISEYSKEIIGADRCSVFIYDDINQEFWTTISDGVDEIIIAKDEGIVGQTMLNAEGIIENDLEMNPNFLFTVDKKTGYKTKNLITAPIFNDEKEIIGVLELLNKEGGFNDTDLKYMKFFAQTLSGFVDLVNLYTKS